MLKSYLKVAWRNLLKSKVFSLINILGLTIGITVCLMIYLFILNEFSFDKFHANKKNIYRVMRGFDKNKERVPYLSGPYATALLNDFPGEIKSAVRVMPTSGVITLGTTSFNEKRLYMVDSNFFRFFSFPLLKGNPATALQDPNGIVLTESTARKYFGKEDPMNKIIELNKSRKLKVTGIAKDVPSNSHLDFDAVVPISIFLHEDFFNVWINNNHFVYVQLDEHASKAAIERRFPAFMNKYMAKEMALMQTRFDLALTPLSDVYFEPESGFDNVRHGDKKIVYIFLSIAVLILLIACINFMNLSTIRAVERSKEVGLRKVMGALRGHLVGQFIGESIILAFISCICSVILLQISMPLYDQILGHSLTVSWNTPPVYLFLAGVVIVVGFLAGSYPAFFLSAFSPIESLKGKLKLGKGGALFRETLVVIQFSISVFLVIGTIIIMNQLNYVKNKELGYEQEHTVIVPLDNDHIADHRVAFKNELQSKSNINSVSLMSGEPGGFFDQQPFEAEDQPAVVNFRSEFADFEYVRTLGLKVIAGRDLSPQYKTDSTGAVLINRTAAARLGFTPEQAVGKWIKNPIRDSLRRRVVGVVEDFNFLSLKEKMDGLVISTSEDRRVVAIKLRPGNLTSAMETIRKTYGEMAPGFPFEYSFLDQKFDELYKKDIRQQAMISLFSGLAIFIACLGLFGLASFTANKRLKEIGVRKVLGSSVRGIVLLLSKDLLKPVLIATFIAMPVGYYAMHRWLENFAYHTSLHWWVFALAAVLTIAIALLTVSLKALKAALTNPVKSLKTE